MEQKPDDLWELYKESESKYEKMCDKMKELRECNETLKTNLEKVYDAKLDKMRDEFNARHNVTTDKLHHLTTLLNIIKNLIDDINKPPNERTKFENPKMQILYLEELNAELLFTNKNLEMENKELRELKVTKDKELEMKTMQFELEKKELISQIEKYRKNLALAHDSCASMEEALSSVMYDGN